MPTIDHIHRAQPVGISDRFDDMSMWKIKLFQKFFQEFYY